MFLSKQFVSIIVLFCSLIAMSTTQDDPDEEGTVVSQNPLIEGEELPTDETDSMYSTDFDDGDVELSETQKKEYNDEASGKYVSSSVKLKYKWPKSLNGKHVLIPYVIQGGVYTAPQLALIQQAMYDIQNVTCIHFIKRNKQKDYFQIFSQKGKGCYSALGRVGGLQKVSLNKNGCIYRKTIVHELIHVVGFHHMFQRYDRNDYLNIWYGNVKDTAKYCFTKLNNKYEAYGTKFDLLSAMMYKKKAFSKNGKDTMEPKDASYLDLIGAVPTLSNGDALRINRMYSCPAV